MGEYINVVFIDTYVLFPQCSAKDEVTYNHAFSSFTNWIHFCDFLLVSKV